MPLILNIDTATTVCSVALFHDSELLALREVNDGYTHAENLHVFISEVMSEAGRKFSNLHAIAVSRGPGSYTGLRIGVSAAKGLCFALQIPLIAVDTLMVMSASAATRTDTRLLCPMLDARRMEVYTALYNHNLKKVIETQALVVDEETIKIFAGEPVCFFGDGMSKSRLQLTRLPGATFLEDIVPSSKFMGAIALKNFEDNQFEDVAYFEPFYLKDFFVPQKSTK